LWETGRDALVQYRAENDGNYPKRVEPYVWLYVWIHNQRSTRRTMSDEQRGALDAIGFCWSVPDEKWERMRFKVALHLATHGTMPPKRTEIGMWAHTQRYSKRIGTLRADRILILEAMPGWVWDLYEAAWDRNYSELRALGRMPPSTSRLGTWAHKQRSGRASLGALRSGKPEALPGWNWEPREAEKRWLERYAELSALGSMPRQIRARGSMPPTSAPLYSWVRYQLDHRATMSADHALKLSSLGFWRWRDEPQ
jgi:hypothetical protein